MESRVNTKIMDTEVSGVDMMEYREYIGEARYELLMAYVNRQYQDIETWIDVTECKSLWDRLLKHKYSDELFKITIEYIIIFTVNNTCTTDSLKEYYEYIMEENLIEGDIPEMLNVYLASLGYLTKRLKLNGTHLPVEWMNDKLKVLEVINGQNNSYTK